MKKDIKVSVTELRAKAEEQLKNKTTDRNLQNLSDTDFINLIHELEINQIVLEMQNEELRQEENKHQSDELYKSLFENNHSIMLVIDPDSGLIKDANNAACLYYGWTHNQMCSKNIAEINTLSPQEILVEMQLAREEKRTYFLFKHRLSTGQIHDVEVYSGPINLGNSTFLYSMVHDISDRKIAELALSESEERYRILADSGEALIWTSAADKKCNYFNKVWLDFTGRTIDQEIGDGWAEGVYPDDCHRYFETYSDAFDRYESFGVDFRLRRHDGEYRWLQARATPQYSSLGDFIGYIGHCLDITKNKMAENEINDKSTLLSNLLINLQEGILLEDSDRKIILSNQMFCDLFAIPAPPEALVGNDCSDSAEQSKCFFKEPGKFVADLALILSNKVVVLNEELELADGRYLERDYIPNYIANKYTGHLWKYRDITERKQSELKLARSEERFRQVVEQSQEVVWEINPSGLYTYISPLSTTVYGYSPEQMTGKFNFFELHQQLGMEVSEATVSEVFRRNGSVNNLVSCILKSDGKQAFIATNGKAILNKKGDLLGYRGTDTDVSKKIQAEEKIKLQNEQLNAIISAMPDLIFVLDKDGNSKEYDYSNPEDLFSTDDLAIGTNINMLFDNETVSLHLHKIEQCILKDRLVSFEYRIEKNNGPGYYEARMVPLSSENVLTIVRDITQEKVKDHEIKKLYLAVEQSPVSIVITDLNGIIEYVNPAILATTGYNYEELIGCNTSIFKSGRTDTSVYDDLWKTISHGKIWDGEWLNKKKSGELFWMNVSVNPILSESGKITNYLAIMQDITLRKHSEEQIYDLNANLESKIEERTAQLADINQVLQKQIKDHKKTSEAYHEALNRLHKIADRVPGVVYQFRLRPDGTSCFPYASEGIRDIYRVTPEEIFNDASIVFSRLHPEDFEDVVATIQASAQNLTLWRHEYRVKFEDGSIHWLLGNALPQRDEDGSVLWHGFISDITERRHADDALTWNQSLLQMMSNSSPLGFLVVDNRSDDIIYFNHRFCQIWGIEHISENMRMGKMKNNDIIPYCLPVLADIPAFAESCKPLQDEANRIVVEDEIAFTNNRTVHRYSTQIRGEHDEYFGRFYIFEDITQRHQAEDALLESNQKWEAIISASPDGIGMVSLDGKLHLVSDKLANMYGYSIDQKGELIGKSILEFIDPTCHKILAENIHRLYFGEKQHKISEYIAIKKDKSTFPIDVNSTLLVDSDGNPEFILFIERDITEPKKNEEEIKRARMEAEYANMAKSEFLSRMSHELRTPMNSILGFAQLLEMGELSPGQKKWISHILQSGNHLLDLINEVLDISRIEAGRISLSLEPVDLKSTILEMMDTVQLPAKSRKLTLKLENSAMDSLFVQADRQRLKQIFLNLLNNAIKYNKSGGSVTIKNEIIQTNETGVFSIRTSVTDTGLGISPENICKLFKPFERIGAEKTHTEGTGLGLSVVKKLTDLMGGKIGVWSVEGEGSTFWVEFPKVEVIQVNNPKSVECKYLENRPTNKMGKILYIEDNTSNIELVEQILNLLHSNIRMISNAYGKQAVPLAIEFAPDLILLDLNLPDIDGRQVLRLLQSEEKTKAIPVVIISADAMPHQLENILKEGARNYLTKPLDVNTFIKVVDEFIPG
jgi:PAS domain S-box-containing protein